MMLIKVELHKKYQTNIKNNLNIITGQLIRDINDMIETFTDWL